MKKINLIILSTFITWMILLNFNVGYVFSLTLEKVDRNLIPLLIPPYQMINDIQTSELPKVNVTYINNFP